MMITEIEDFFTKGCGRCERFATPDCSTRRWIDGLNALRRLCREAGLVETVKWGHPCYMHAGRNVAIFGAFRGDFRLTFFHPALMTDPQGLLEAQGPHSRHRDAIRFTDTAKVTEIAPVLRAYLREAMGYAEAGLKPPEEPGADGADLPLELVDALTADPALAAAYESLTPGRQRSYLIALSSAKTSETRRVRIAKFRAKILAGKGATER